MDSKTRSNMAKMEADLRAMGERYIRAANEIADAIRLLDGHDVDTGTPRPLIPQGLAMPTDGYIAAAVDVLREQGREMHISELTNFVQTKLGRPVERNSVESALVRAKKTEKWKDVITRTKRATYGLKEQKKLMLEQR